MRAASARPLAAEFVGTFALVFAGCGAATSPQCSTSKPTPCCGPFANSATKACRIPPRTWVTVAAPPDRSELIVRARDLVTYGRTHGYRIDDLISIMEHL